MRKRNLILFLTLFLLVPLFSQQPDKNKFINFTIISIKASNKQKEKIAKKVDSDIITILKSLYKFKTYEEISRKKIKVTEGKKNSVSLPNSLTFEIVSKSEGDTIDAKIIIKDENNQELLNSNIEMQKDKKVILGGWPYNDDTLIIVVRAS